MGIFDGDPKFEKLRQIREVEGYTGWLDQDLKKVDCPSCGQPDCTAGLTEPCNG